MSLGSAQSVNICDFIPQALIGILNAKDRLQTSLEIEAKNI